MSDLSGACAVEWGEAERQNPMSGNGEVKARMEQAGPAGVAYVWWMEQVVEKPGMPEEVQVVFNAIDLAQIH